MAIRIAPILSEPLYLRDLSEEVMELEDYGLSNGGCPPDERAWVIVRQATEGDNIRVGQMTADGKKVEARDVRQMEIYLCLVDTGNIELEEGKPLFMFEGKDHYRKIKGSFEEFKKKFKQLPSPVPMALLRAVYQINKDWDWLTPRNPCTHCEGSGLEPEGEAEEEGAQAAPSKSI